MKHLFATCVSLLMDSSIVLTLACPEPQVLPDFGDENLMAVGFRAAVALSTCAIILAPSASGFKTL